MDNVCDCLSPQELRIQNKDDKRAGRERVFSIMDTFMHSVPNIDIERARYFTESMKQTEGQPLPLRWAKALMNCAAKMTVYITPNQLIAGRSGKEGRYGILYPEIDGDFYAEVLSDVSKREKSPFNITQEEIDILLAEVAPYWEGKTYHEHLNGAMPAELRGVTYADERGLRSKFVVSETSSYRSALQWVHDYEKVLKHGFLGIKELVQQRLDRLDELSPVDIWDKKPCLEAMLIVCDAVMLWARRHADLAREQAKTASPKRKAELLRLAEVCEHVPANPARNFYESVQSQWFVQMFSRIEQKASAVISNGRMDQYLYPYYRQDIASGAISEAEAMELLECMWVEMAQFIDLYINPTGNEFNEAYAHWEAVTIGGQTPDGYDATNELSYLFLRSKREFPLNYPDLAARIHSRSAPRFLYEVAETIKDGSGFPKLINDEEVVPLYTMKGAPLREALDYAVSGCTEARLPNRDTYTSGCVYINMGSALEMTLYNGRMLKYGEDDVIGPETGDPLTFTTWDDFWQAYTTQHMNLIAKAFAQQYVVDCIRPQHFATPFASVMHDLCVEACKDLQSQKIDGGIDYSYFEILGYATVVDSLAAIKKLVYEDKVLTMREVLSALKDDFGGHEAVRELLRSAPSYGNNDPYADSIAKALDRMTQEYAEKYSAIRGVNCDVRYVPITSHVPFGKVVSATPNGRLAWMALSDGSSASHGADHNGPTGVLLSNYHSKNYDLKNRASRLLNIKLSPKSVAGEEGTEKIVNIIRTWCDLKLWHLQFNIINRSTLLAAQKEPDNYRSLLVRIAGYSAYFCDLSKDLQNDIIERTEHTSV